VVRACILRVVAAVIPALLLGACLRDPYVYASATEPIGSWRIEKQTDRVTGTPINSAYVITRTSSNADSLFPQPAMMSIGCFLGSPIVKFAFEFKVGTNMNSFLGYRFDEKPGHEIGARFVANSSAVVIEDKAEVAQFINELATSNVLYVRIRSLNAGRSAAEFKVDGAAAAIEAALAGCPVAQPAPAPQRATPPVRRPNV
jgi:hypothetical protein